ncbi:hypothetical protein SKAU_G00365360 [Synaphobranchus kaupii]|uniref:Uncharacterized protein n=1 Tax=Synaphobranchus kaupii TaxID=118154 RepID=A0A9Q1EEY9_SYNKA|nr:hypothetical protein SKAU_G00365360 [Synaphobranchus kaupii]
MPNSGGAFRRRNERARKRALKKTKDERAKSEPQGTETRDIDPEFRSAPKTPKTRAPPLGRRPQSSSRSRAASPNDQSAKAVSTP